MQEKHQTIGSRFMHSYFPFWNETKQTQYHYTLLPLTGRVIMVHVEDVSQLMGSSGSSTFHTPTPVFNDSHWSSVTAHRSNIGYTQSVTVKVHTSVCVCVWGGNSSLHSHLLITEYISLHCMYYHFRVKQQLEIVSTQKLCGRYQPLRV